MARTKSRFVCQECGYVASSWLGRCPECGGWNTLVEEAEVTARQVKAICRLIMKNCGRVLSPVLLKRR